MTDSSAPTHVSGQNTMLQMSNAANFAIQEQDLNRKDEGEAQPNDGQEDRMASVSEAPTQDYERMWENESDRQRVMARFRSFDMTGMTEFNSYNQRSPSDTSQLH
mgnify:CR=1 FL=1